MFTTVFRSLWILFLLLSLAGAEPVSVRMERAGGFLRDGKPYFVRGAGGHTRLADLKARGGNSLRTWSTDDLGKILDDAHQHQLTVCAGIWLEPECDWFSYQNPAHCARQAERVAVDLDRYRHHPALLCWGLGNEVEGDGRHTAFWNQLEKLAQLVHAKDPNHPCCTALAGINATKIEALQKMVPSLDFIGINTYGGLFSLRQTLQDGGWDRPWLVTEWGAPGFWERPRGAGGMALELTSTQKARFMDRAYQEVLAINPAGNCLGSYAFFWGWKYEGTATWFGLATDRGDWTAAVDVLQLRWSGTRPGNAAPELSDLEGAPPAAVAPQTPLNLQIKASDPDHDLLEWTWAILPEATGHDAGATPPMPTAVPVIVEAAGPGKWRSRAPAQPGKYRVHVWVRDGKGHAATANAPVLVQ